MCFAVITTFHTVAVKDVARSTKSEKQNHMQSFRRPLFKVTLANDLDSKSALNCYIICSSEASCMNFTRFYDESQATSSR